jgi:hypothetical protein
MLRKTRLFLNIRLELRSMNAITDREQLLTNVVRLRRAERDCRASPEIRTVRRDLERKLGPTVTRAVAARALGVSQTALERWIERGGIPVVMTPRGRHEVPLRALVDLVDAVEERRSKGDRFPLASVLEEQRLSAELLDLRRILPRRHRRDSEGGHRGAELRGLAYHRAVAERLNEEIVADALDQVQQWRSESRLDPRYADQWEEVLSRPVSRIARFISEDSPRARGLRQNSPFAGVLTEPERRRVLEAVHSLA